MIMEQKIDLNLFFEKERIFKYVKNFSFPRLSGTEGEQKAVELAIKTFKDIGLKENQIEYQRFDFSTFYSEVLLKIIAFMSMVIVSILLFIKYIYPFFTITIILIMVVIFLSIVSVLKHPEYQGFWENHFGKKVSATNVFVKVNAKNHSLEKAGNIIISAHLDSKSQTFKTIWRVIFFTIWEIGGIVLSILYTFFLIDLYFHVIQSIILMIELGIIITTSLIILSNVMLLYLKTENKSLGALDNASGMAIIFELSSFFKDHSAHNFNLWFCQFSAEEIGTMGSRLFLDSFETIFSNKNTFQINFDMISGDNNNQNRVEYVKSYGAIPPKKISEILESYVNNAAKEENVYVKGFKILSGAHTDTVPFHLRKYDSLDFATFDASKYSHSKEDTPDKVNPTTLFNACKLVTRMVINLDKNFKISF
jgi:putative aminopeptidase FrvX